MNPLSLIKPRYRVSLYLIFSLLNVITVYLQAKTWIGGPEASLINGLGAILGVMAASNVDVSPPEPPNLNA